MDASVASSARKALVISECDMLSGSCVVKPLGQPVVYDVHYVRSLLDAHQEIIGLDIAVHKGALVHIAEPFNLLVLDIFEEPYELLNNHKSCLERKLSRAEVEEILERRSEKLYDHIVDISFSAVGVDLWDAGCALQDFYYLCFVENLRVSGVR